MSDSSIVTTIRCTIESLHFSLVMSRVVRSSTLSFSPDDFFSVNRFLYDALVIPHKVTMKSISAVLKMPSSSLRKRLLALKMPTTARTLQKSAKSCSDHLSKPPNVMKSTNDFWLMEKD